MTAFACGRVTGLVATVVLLALPPPASSDPELDLPDALQNATYVGESACLECHEEYDLSGGIHDEVPAFQAPGVNSVGCEACHGPGSLHADSGEPEDIVNAGTALPVLANQMCVQCHRPDAHEFQTSLHAMSDVGCVSCHSLHGDQRRALLRDTEVEVCLTCHEDVRSQTYLPSRHPIRDGKMVCTDCHDPHGGDLQTRLAHERTNELCLQCHAQKEGPYVFEHSPVIEDCGICHAPHGSVATPLLRQNEPFLCLQCHQTHFHATLSGIEGDFTSLDGYSGTSTRDAAKRGFMTKCTQCHTEVHGSDLPSQSISGLGGALTR